METRSIHSWEQCDCQNPWPVGPWDGPCPSASLLFPFLLQDWGPLVALSYLAPCGDCWGGKNGVPLHHGAYPTGCPGAVGGALTGGHFQHGQQNPGLQGSAVSQATRLPAGLWLRYWDKPGPFAMTCGASARKAEVAGVSPTGREVLWVTLQCQCSASRSLWRPGPPNGTPLSPPPWSCGPAHQPRARAAPRAPPAGGPALARRLLSRGAPPCALRHATRSLASGCGC